MEKLLTIKEAADAMGVSVRFMEEHAEIPRILVGKGNRPLIRFRPSDLERLLDAWTINPLPPKKKVA
jgi:hypothetical protein